MNLEKQKSKLAMLVIMFFVSCLGVVNGTILSILGVVFLLMICVFILGLAKPSLVRMESRNQVVKELGFLLLSAFYFLGLVFAMKQGITTVVAWIAIPVEILLILSLAKPSLIKMDSRKSVLKYLGLFSFIILILFSVLPSPPKSAVNNSEPNKQETSNIVANQGDKTNESVGVSSQTQATNQDNNQTEQTQAVTPQPAKTEESKPVTKNITVTNTINKKVNGKCRYFFNVMNNENVAFSGAVNIDILTSSGLKITGGNFVATQATPPGQGAEVYFDLSTCPSSDGGNAIGYAFQIKDNNQIVNSGSIRLTNEFEDVDMESKTLGY